MSHTYDGGHFGHLSKDKLLLDPHLPSEVDSSAYLSDDPLFIFSDLNLTHAPTSSLLTANHTATEPNEVVPVGHSAPTLCSNGQGLESYDTSSITGADSAWSTIQSYNHANLIRDELDNNEQIPHAPPASSDDLLVAADATSVGASASYPLQTFATAGEGFSAGGSYAMAIPAANGLSQQTVPASAVSVTSGGITINLLYDSAALAAPASFRDGIQQAASILTAAISDQITVNLKIDYSGTGGGASAGPDNGLFESYSSVRANLINHATAGDSTFAALPNGTSVQGQSQVAVWNAELKLFGLLSSNDTTTDDGTATFATDINPNLLVGVALHELTHAIGRVPYGPQPDIFDLFRFTGPGTMLFQNGSTAPAAYLSLDGGNTKIADYGQSSDASDFLNSGVQGPNDPFNEFYTSGTGQQLSAIDLKQLDALGFHLSGSAPPSSGTPNSSPILDFVENKSDLNGDGNNDVVLRYTTGQVYLWQMNGSQVTTSQQVSNLPTSWHIQNSGDFNGDGKGDLLVRNDSGQLYEWQMNGASVTSSQELPYLATDWHIQNTGDFNGDGKSDILLRNDSGQIYLWTMNGNSVTSSQKVSDLPTQWHIQGTGDFNGDGKSDILLRNDSGQIYLWTMNGATVTSSQQVSNLPNEWHVQSEGDFSGDGKADVLLRNDSGQIYLWTMNGASVTSSHEVSILPTDWHTMGEHHHDMFGL